MNMTVKKTVLMTLKPMILKYNSIVWGRSGLSDIRDGIYLMKIGMQKDYLDPMANKGVVITDDIYPKRRNGSNLQTMSQTEAENIEKRQFLVVKQTLVRVLGGKIVTPIEFEIDDLRTLRIRSQMLIQLETIDEMLLRAALLANEKLNGLVNDYSSAKTIEVMSIQDTLEELSRKLQEHNENVNMMQMDEYMRILARSKELQERMKQILDLLDEQSVEHMLAQIEEIRRSGETAISVDRNIKFRALNQALEALKVKMRKAQQEIASQAEKDAREGLLQECQYLMSNLINAGRTQEAQLYDPKNADNPGSLCKTHIPRDELFYYMSTGSRIGSDEWFRALLTPEEFQLFKTNLLRDDFTRPYPPDFDFSLLSNQGDERFLTMVVRAPASIAKCRDFRAVRSSAL